MYCETSNNSIEQQARRNAGKKLGWYLHACAYLCINLALMALAFSQGRHWAIYPALGWGLGLLIHGLVVWLVSASSPVRQRMVAREMQSLQKRDSAD